MSNSFIGRLFSALLLSVMVNGLAVAAETSDTIKLLKDINSTSYAGVSSNPEEIVEFGGHAYFRGDSSSAGTELWRTDGTTTELFVDIHTDGSSNPQGFIATSNYLFFVADDGEHGLELWRTDGTQAGTVLVKDIYTGSLSGLPESLTVFNDTLFFVAHDLQAGVQLWKSDGTVGGTIIVDEVHPSGIYEPYHLVEYQSELLFVRLSGAIYELWSTDGATVSKVSDLPVKPSSKFVEMAGNLYFSGLSDSYGDELWQWDGTSLSIVLDINETDGGAGSASPRHLTVADSVLYFEADDGVNGAAIWMTDGTTTTLVKDVASAEEDVALLQLMNVGTEIFFWVVNGDDNEVRLGRLVDNGATAVALGKVDELPHLDLLELNGTVYFPGWYSFSGTELVSHKPGVNNPSVFIDISPDSADSFPFGFVEFGGGFLFSADDGVNGRELWWSDGTKNNTKRLSNAATAGSQPAYLTVVDDKLYFSANDDGLYGSELWSTDGTDSGTELVKDIATGGRSSSPRFLTEVNGDLGFIADNSDGKTELWQSNEGEFAEVMDITIDITSDSFEMVAMGGRLYYAETDPKFVDASSQTIETEEVDTSDSDIGQNTRTVATVKTTVVTDTVWESDNETGLITETVTETKTLSRSVKVLDLTTDDLIEDQGTETKAPTVTTTEREVDESDGVELWRSNGKLDNTRQVRNINTSGDAYPHTLTPTVRVVETDNGTARQEYLYFVADDGLNGQELWLTTGKGSTTRILQDIKEDGSSHPKHITPVNNEFIYFTAANEKNGNELWRADMGKSEATLVKDIRERGDSNPANLTNVDGTLFFTASDGHHGEELWKSDGTEEGTVMVKDLRAGSAGTRFKYLTAIGDKLYFTADDGQHGFEVWVSDGTAAGTKMLMDINANGDSDPVEFTALGDDVFFTAFDQDNGRELWRTDGTAAGTELALDINPTGSSNPSELTIFNDDIYFVANDGSLGRELWVVDRTVLGENGVSSNNSGGSGAISIFEFALMVCLLASIQRRRFCIVQRGSM